MAGSLGREIDGYDMCFAAPFAVSDSSETEDVEKNIVAMMIAPIRVITHGPRFLLTGRG